MPYFVYILYSQKDNKLYTGYTKNLKERLQKHTRGKVLSTKNRRPLVLIYHEEIDTKQGAIKREHFFKNKVGKHI